MKQQNSVLGAFLSVVQPSVVYGANIGMDSFLKALLKHSSFDEIHIFFDAISLINSQQSLSELLKSREEFSKLKLKNLLDLSRDLQDGNYVAFYQGNPFIGNLSYLRSEFSGFNFPVTGTAHTISYHFVLVDLFLTFASRIQPFDSIVCTSRAQKKALAELFLIASENLKSSLGVEPSYGGRLDIIPFGVDSVLYHPRDKEDLRNQLELPKEKLIILWVGRFSAYDKVDLCPLLLVFKEILEKEADVVLLLAGDDKHKYAGKVKVFADELGIADKIIIMTDPPLKLVPLLYSACDIFLAPSDNLQETFGLVVIEAMASGLPVVVSDFDGYRELVIHNETGFVVPTYWAKCDQMINSAAPLSSWLLSHLYLSQSICVDFTKMREYVLVLVENPELRRKMGEAGRKRVLENYDWHIIIKQYEELWRELSQEAKGVEQIQSGALFKPQYFRAFKHYTTSLLDEESEINLSERGKDLLGEKAKPVDFYAEMGVLLNPGVMEGVIVTLGEGGWMKVGNVVRKMEEVYGIASEMAIYQIMWMMKYGVLEAKTGNLSNHVDIES